MALLPQQPSKLVKVVLWFGSVVVASTIGLLLKHLYEAPRANVELLQIDTSAPEEDVQISIGAALDSNIRRHPYYPNLNITAPIAEVRGAMEKAQQVDGVFSRAIEHIDDLVDLAKRQGDLPLPRRRKDFLLQLVSKDQEAVEIARVGKFVTDSFEFPDYYRRHPEGQERLRIDLGASIYTLEELDPEVLAAEALRATGSPNRGTEVKIDAERTNQYRRVLAYFEPAVVVDFFLAIRERLVQGLATSETISSQLTELMSEAVKARLQVTLLIGNRGLRPLPLWGVGVLLLEVPDPESTTSHTIPVRLVDPSLVPTIHVIAGGEATQVALVSDEALDTIISKHPDLLGGEDWQEDRKFDSSRLNLLWRANTPSLRGRVAVARAGTGPEDALAAESKDHVIGSAGIDEVYRRIGG